VPSVFPSFASTRRGSLPARRAARVSTTSATVPSASASGACSTPSSTRPRSLGRLIARADCVRLLENRLRIVHTLRRHPEIERQDIRQPIFIVGLPRTGTTILPELLAQDPANRVPMTWEVMHPWPPPERATYRTDPRIAQVEKHFAGVDRLVPGFKAMHPMGAELPQECVALTAHDFASMLFSTTHDVPSYDAWLKPGHATGQEP